MSIIYKNFYNIYLNFIFYILNFNFYPKWPLTLRCPFITAGSSVSPTNLYKTLILYIGLLARDLLWGGGS